MGKKQVWRKDDLVNKIEPKVLKRENLSRPDVLLNKEHDQQLRDLQMEGIDIEKIFSLVVKLLSIVILVAMVVDDDQQLHLIIVNATLFLKR